MKHALITGITGQDGSYLAELLLDKGYEVYGLMRRKSVVDYGNVDHIKDKIHFIYADMTDQTSLIHAMTISQADEVYNLAAQSFVATSWEQPLATAEIDAIGVTNMLEAIRVVKPEAHFYQASTSELYGKVEEVPQRETTPFHPYSPYAVAKQYGFWITKEYREAYEEFDGKFRVGMGAEAIKELLQAIDLDKEAEALKQELFEATGQKKAKIVKRLEVHEAFRNSGNSIPGFLSGSR